MEDVYCCDQQNKIIYDGNVVCENCGCILYTHHEEDDKAGKSFILPNIKINLSKQNKSNRIYITTPQHYLNIKKQSLLKYLKIKNNKSPEKIHEKILEATVSSYIRQTKKRIFRSGKRAEILSWLLYKQCLKWNNPRTETFITSFMELERGGFSRGVKAIEKLKKDSDQYDKDNNDTETINTFNDKLIIINCTLTNLLGTNGSKRYYHTIIKMYNFTDKLGIFSQFRLITKIVGCIWILICEKNIDYYADWFKKTKIEKNTVNNFYKTIKKSMYWKYYQMILDDPYKKY